MNQPQVRHSAFASRINLREEPARQDPGRNDHNRPPSDPLDSTALIDAACNRLQALMQLLYLLGRDAAIPSDARYHVTIAQSEIALLSRIMQNSAGAEIEAAHAHPSL